MVRTLDKTHTVLSYIDGSLKNATIVNGDNKYDGFIFSLLNPPVPLGGNIVSLDIYVDEIPVPKKSIFIATSEDVVNAATLSEDRPIPFKPFQSARFLIIKDDGLKEQTRHKNGFLYTRHEVAGLQVKRTLFVPPDNKGFVMKLELLDRDGDYTKLSLKKKTEKTRRKIRIHFVVDGNITSYGLAAISQSNFSKLLTRDNCLQIQTAAKKNLAHFYGTIGVAPKTLRPSRVLMDSFDNDLEISYDLDLEV